MTPPRPARTIVALGDSTTAGTPGFLSPIEAPPDGVGEVRSQFAWWMMQAEPGWRVLNRGVNRERTEAIAARLDRDVLAHRPDVLILLAGVNDVYDGDAAVDVQRRLAEMYARATRRGVPVVACSILPYDTATAEQNTRMHAINAWIADMVTVTPGLAFCDMRAAVAHPDDADRLIDSPDGLHPGVDGYRRIAAALLPVVRALLATR